MEALKTNARNFMCKIQGCNEQQQKMFQEILEGLHSFIEEILLSRHISVGETDSIDVQQLLYHDFLELVHHSKRETAGGKGAQMHQQKGVEDTVQCVGHKVTAKPIEEKTEEEQNYHDKPPQAMKDDSTRDLEEYKRKDFDEFKRYQEEHKRKHFDKLKRDLEEYKRKKFDELKRDQEEHKRKYFDKLKRDLEEYKRKNVDELKRDQEEHKSKYFDKLKTMKEKRIRSLHKRTTVIVRSITQTRDKPTSTHPITAEEIISMKMEAQERADLTEFLSVATNILQDVSSVKPGDQMLESILENIEKHRTTFNYQNQVYKVDEITKRNLGKMMIRLVGHEGMETKPDLRRLLRACIDFVQKRPGGWLKNASITIYDEEDNMYKIASGAKKEQFICEMVDDEPIIRNKLDSSLPKKPKVYNEQAPGQSGRERDGCLLM